MKRLGILAAALALAGEGLCAESAIFADDFTVSMTLQENWILKNDKPRVVDGKLRLPAGSREVTWNGVVPMSFVLEMKMTVKPGWSKSEGKRGRVGIRFSDGRHFFLREDGGISHGGGGRPALVGKPVRFTLSRTPMGAGRVRYVYSINGNAVRDEMCDAGYDDKEKTRPCQPQLCTENIDWEVDEIKFSTGKKDGSPNLVINSGFEYETEGVPRYHFLGSEFDWKNFTGDDYEKYFLDGFKVVEDEKHSGRKSLRVKINKTTTYIGYHPGSRATEKDKAGVFSLWMKSTMDGLPLVLSYGDGKREVRVGKTWKRYEVCASKLPKPDWFTQYLSMHVLNPAKYDATLWIDDVQCEFVESPEMKSFSKWKKGSAKPTVRDDDPLGDGDDEDALTLDVDVGKEAIKKYPGGFDPSKSYATPYRPSDLDEMRFGPGLADNDASPRGETPVVLRDEAALRGYVRAEGETVVLPQFSYYMNEKTAKFRVWDEKGRLAESEVDVSALPCGTNAVTVKAHGRDFAGEIVKLPYYEGAARANNFSRSIEHRGKPLFHIGLASLSRKMPMSADGKRNNSLDYMRKLGFNTVHMPIWFGDRYAIPAVAAVKYCEQTGMGMLLWPGETGQTEEGMRQAAQKQWEEDGHRTPVPASRIEPVKWPRDATLKKMYSPCIFAMQVLDEPDMSVPSDKARDWIRYNKNLFPHTPIFINNTCIKVGSDYADKEGDINMLDDYLTNNEFRNVDSVVRHVDRMRRQKPGKPAWNFLVGMNSGHCRQPTYAEQTAQSWGWVCGGGTGFSWYLEFPNVSPNLRAMKDINREMQSLRDVILSEEIAGEAGFDVGVHHMRAITRLHRGAWHVLACNVDHKPFEKVTFTMPPDGPKDGTVEVLFENRTIPLKGGVFSDAFAGHSRHVYRVK